MDLRDIYIRHVEACLYWSDQEKSKLNNDILYNLNGMTGRKTRHFYNNLCSLPDSRYLEIGAWLGSSSISSLFMNPHCRATIIDNWSEFNGKPEHLIQNIKTYIPHNVSCNLINEDCFNLSTPLDSSYNIYLYDGAHDALSQKKGITEFIKYIDPISIIVIDDWNYPPAREGTWEGFNESGIKILYKKEILLTTDGTHTPYDKAHADYWNGMAVFVVEK